MYSVRERDVLNHFLETGKPLKISSLTVGDAAQWYKGIMPVGINSDYAPPRQGWLPTAEILREEIIKLHASVAAADASIVIQFASNKTNISFEFGWFNSMRFKVKLVKFRKKFKYVNLNDTGLVSLTNKCHPFFENHHGCHVTKIWLFETIRC